MGLLFIIQQPNNKRIESGRFTGEVGGSIFFFVWLFEKERRNNGGKCGGSTTCSFGSYRYLSKDLSRRRRRRRAAVVRNGIDPDPAEKDADVSVCYPCVV